MSKPDTIPEDGNLSPYNAPQLMAMKEDIANRAFRIKMTGMIITGLFAVAAVAAMFFMPVGSLAMGKVMVSGALALGGAVTNIITMREAKKLEIDENYIQSYMQGKNYWGAGYRQEVAEHGYSAPSLTMQGPPMGPSGKSHQHGSHR